MTVRRVAHLTARRLAAALAVLMAGPATALGQRPSFAPTLYWESGLINAPAAHVPPLGGDLATNFVWVRGVSGRQSIGGRPLDGNYNLSLSASIWGRAEAGVSIFASDLSNGLFGKLMIWDQTDAIWRRGVVHWLPSVAVGARNVGGRANLDRFTIADSGGAFRTAPTLYGVASRTFVLAPGETPDRPRAQLSVTVGAGNGLFSDDGGYADYGASATGGVFGGVALDVAAGRHRALSFVVEHDAWDINLGARADLMGVRIAAHWTGVTRGGAPAIAIGWQTNVWALARGDRLQERASALERQQGDLARQVRLSQQLIDVIEGQIEALRAIATQEKNAERAELERRLREEQEALRRLQELIRQREAARRPPAPAASGQR